MDKHLSSLPNKNRPTYIYELTIFLTSIKFSKNYVQMSCFWQILSQKSTLVHVPQIKTIISLFRPDFKRETLIGESRKRILYNTDRNITLLISSPSLTNIWTPSTIFIHSFWSPWLSYNIFICLWKNDSMLFYMNSKIQVSVVQETMDLSTFIPCIIFLLLHFFSNACITAT